MEIEDAAHYTDAQRAAIIASYPAHEREARAKGLPSRGSGLVFPVTEDTIACDPFPIPSHYVQINGLDFGIDHPFAATRNAWDRDTDIWYVTATYRQKGTTPPTHVAAIRPWGDWIPCAWPHDGLQRDKGSGDQLAEQYRKGGLNMLHEHATHAEGGSGVEAGIMEMLERMETGRWKVFRGLTEWFGEMRDYHRKDGQIVALRDDLLSSSRYALMMRRFAKQNIKRKALNLAAPKNATATTQSWMR
jgi:hypothetical protein